MAAKVLIVEDDFDIRGALSDLLTDEGYLVVQAENGAAALKQLEGCGEELPRLILLDLMMPVMNGWQFMAEKTLRSAFAEIPVLILSADDDLARKAAELKVRGYFRKPVEIDNLLDRVAEYCA